MTIRSSCVPPLPAARTALPVTLTAALALVVSACSSGGSSTSAASPARASTSASTTGSPITGTPTTSASSSSSSLAAPGRTVRAGTVLATGLDAPWGLAFLPDGSALVSQRDDAAIVRVTKAGAKSRVGVVPGVLHGGEGGLLGLAVAPTYARDHLLYAYRTTSTGNQVVRMTYTPRDGLGRPSVILEGIRNSVHHNGGRLAFGPDGKLYVTTGDAEVKGAAQDRSSLNGKILRIDADGSIPADNPFRSPVWSYGHRNVQGIAWDAQGRLWADEFGQNTWDELNLIRKGANYGWPVVEGRQQHAGFVAPVRQWHTDDASPSGITIAGSTIYLAALKGQRLWQVPLAGTSTGTPKALLTGTYGRLRNVARAPDGSLWLVSNNTDGRVAPRRGDDRIVRLTVS